MSQLFVKNFCTYAELLLTTNLWHWFDDSKNLMSEKFKGRWT